MPNRTTQTDYAREYQPLTIVHSAVWLVVIYCVTEVRPVRAQGLSPEESVRRMKMADGFEVQLVANEPLVKQPVAIEFDDRGRLWVIQYLRMSI